MFGLFPLTRSAFYKRKTAEYGHRLRSCLEMSQAIKREAMASMLELLLGNPALVYRLLEGASEARFWLKNNLLSLSLALLAVAWANPQRGDRPRQVNLRSANRLLYGLTTTSPVAVSGKTLYVWMIFFGNRSFILSNR